METGIEYPHDLSLDHHGVGNIDHVVEDFAQFQRDRRLAVSRRSIKQDCTPGIDRRANLVDESVVDRQLGERLLYALPGHELVGDLLHMYARREGVQRDRRRASVLRLGQRLGGPAAAKLRQAISSVGQTGPTHGSGSTEQVALGGALYELGDQMVR